MVRVNWELLNRNELDEYYNQVQENFEFFREGRNLTDEQKEVIQKRDVWIVSYVHGIPSAWKTALGYSFIEKNRAHYMGLQNREWFGKEKYLLGTRGSEPTSLELIDDAEKHFNMERYRLCYVLRFPNKMRLNLDEYRRSILRESADLFLAFAELLNPLEPSCSYFSEICHSTFTEQA